MTHSPSGRPGCWGLLLVNVGTPDGPQTPQVRRYLREFLSDPRVIDRSAVARKALLELVILPRRPGRSAAAYRQIWTERGSPLLFHTQDLAVKLRAAFDGAPVAVGMRYGKPSIASAMGRLQQAGVDRLVVFPQFPQYSSAATGSALAEVFRVAAVEWNVPSIQVIPPFYDHPAYIEAVAQVSRPVLDDFGPDRVLLSFHGLPERHMTKSDTSGGSHCLASDSCCERIVEANRHCYRAQCHATARAVTAALDLAPDEWEVAFQSRLGRDPWILPHTDVRVEEMAAAGVRRLAVLVPSFVADCLETLEEIGIRARASFRDAGGEDLLLVPSLNSHDAWVAAARQLVTDMGPGAIGCAPER